MTRRDSLGRFYGVLSLLAERNGGIRTLRDCHGRLTWPVRGVYFFFEGAEMRSDSGSGSRVVRVGTHALKIASQTTLWKRLSQHGGRKKSGGGNHRGSIFRLLVGEALKTQGGAEDPQSWGIGGHRAAAAAALGIAEDVLQGTEAALEIQVSRYIGEMPFLVLSVDDIPGPESNRGVIERGAIALLSNYRRPALDPPSASWLGRHSGRDRVRESGLWNNNHVDEDCDERFFDVLEEAVARTGAVR
jgi:hypothetical protein